MLRIWGECMRKVSELVSCLPCVSQTLAQCGGRVCYSAKKSDRTRKIPAVLMLIAGYGITEATAVL